MAHFSKKSSERLSTAATELQDICNEAIKEFDFIVLCGHRTREEQNKAYQEGHSRANWPTSKHNKLPSLAVDLAPVKYINGKVTIDWNDIQSFYELSKVIKRIAAEKKISISWGGDWSSLKDYPHYQLTT